MLKVVRKAPVPTTEDSLETTRRRRFDMRQRLKAIGTELDAMSAQRWRASQPEGDAVEAAAEAMARGEPAPAIMPDSQREAELRRERDVLARALTKVEITYGKLKQQAANQVRRDVQPARKAAVLRIAEALVELAAANDAEHRLWSTIPGTKAPPLCFPGIGSASHPDSMLRHWFRAAIRDGLLDEAEAKALLAKGRG